MLFAGFNVYQGTPDAGRDHHRGRRSATCSARRSRTRSATSAAASCSSARAASSTSARRRLDRAHRWFERYGAAGDRRLAADPGRPRGVPVRGRRRRDAVRAVRHLRDARLDRVDHRARRCSGARSGSNWQSWRNHLEYVDYVGRGLIVVGDRVPDRPPRARRTRATPPRRGCRLAMNAAPGARAPRLGQALALGALHGPAELLPISSSGHVALVPWLLGWDYVELDDELRKSFEVALHAGTAAALLITLRDEVVRPSAGSTGGGCADRAVVHARRRSSATRSSGRSSAASARRRTIAAGLLAGSVADGAGRPRAAGAPPRGGGRARRAVARASPRRAR